MLRDAPNQKVKNLAPQPRNRYGLNPMQYRFFDSASTTRCCDSAAQLLQRFSVDDYGNPSSSHAFGQAAAKAIREARLYFAELFRVTPAQVIFTGSGSEADNLAVYGIALQALARRPEAGANAPIRVLASATEHPAIRRTVQSLDTLGAARFDARFVPVDLEGQVRRDAFLDLLTPETALVSIQQVNNITGAELPVEELATLAKQRVPSLVFHTDAVQAFGKTSRTPRAPSAIDLVSISGHKVRGPKGVGALIVLNKKLLKEGLRPLIWGGEQEGGLRSGTQNAGLIAGFHAAARETFDTQVATLKHIESLRALFREGLQRAELLMTADEAAAARPVPGKIHWNSPDSAVPHIVSLSIPGFQTGPLARLLEERGFLISTGSACSSQKIEPDAALAAMGFPTAITQSAIRVSFCDLNTHEDVTALVDAIRESITLMTRLLGGGTSRGHDGSR